MDRSTKSFRQEGAVMRHSIVCQLSLQYSSFRQRLIVCGKCFIRHSAFHSLFCSWDCYRLGKWSFHAATKQDPCYLLQSSSTIWQINKSTELVKQNIFGVCTCPSVGSNQCETFFVSAIKGEANFWSAAWAVVAVPLSRGANFCWGLYNNPPCASRFLSSFDSYRQYAVSNTVAVPIYYYATIVPHYPFHIRNAHHNKNTIFRNHYWLVSKEQPRTTRK